MNLRAQVLTVWLKPSAVGQSLSVDALCVDGTEKEHVGYRHDQVVDECSTSDLLKYKLLYPA
jgi:hypothetical protein